MSHYLLVGPACVVVVELVADAVAVDAGASASAVAAQKTASGAVP